MFISALTGDLFVTATLHLHAAHLSAVATDLASAAGSLVSATQPGGVKTLPQVVDGLRNWIMGILAAVATLFLVIGGLLYVTANGDPASIEQAKGAFKAALTGYAMAVLAPVVLEVLQGILGA